MWVLPSGSTIVTLDLDSVMHETPCSGSSERFFFFKQGKINFWERKCDVFSNFLNLNLFYVIVVNFLKISII